jgi:two-component system, OmpR family, KDP operon response regulator KdpE
MGHVILVVEDEEPNRALLRAVLARATDERLAGVTLLEAPDLTTARAILATNHVDLVLLDVRLPDGNGLSLIMDDAGRQAESPPFVVLSASVLPTERAAAMSMGAAGFLAKPYRPADLIKAVADLLDSRRRGAG